MFKVTFTFSFVQHSRFTLQHLIEAAVFALKSCDIEVDIVSAIIEAKQISDDKED